MRKFAIAATVAVFAVTAVVTAAVADDNNGGLRATLTGYEETPAISTRGHGDFRVEIKNNSISYRLSYSGLEGTAQVAHIHLGQRGVAGGVVAFLCGGGGKPACPSSGTVTGTITAGDVQALPAQGIAAGEIQEVIRAMRAGVTYANVHSTTFSGGEIRGQIGGRAGGNNRDSKGKGGDDNGKSGD
jgi:CHRD domain-containing protein